MNISLTIRRVSLPALALVTSLLATGCLTAPASETNGDAPRLRLNLTLERPAAAGMRLTTLQVMLVSEQGDTLRDLITDAGGSLSGTRVVLNPPSAQGQVLTPRYDLPRSGAWTYILTSRDARDSIIHSARGAFVAPAPGAPLDLNLAPAARYASYDAALTAAASATTVGNDAPARVELALDGTVVHSAPWTGALVACEYLPVGAQRARWRVYGAPRADGREPLLYEGEKEIEIRTASGSVEDFRLTRVAPPAAAAAKTATTDDPAAEGLSLRFGRTGRVVVQVVVPAAVIL